MFFVTCWPLPSPLSVDWVWSVSHHIIVQSSATTPWVHCTLYSLHCTLYGVHSTLYGVHSTLYGVHSTLYGVHCKLYSVHCTMHPTQKWVYKVSKNLMTLRKVAEKSNANTHTKITEPHASTFLDTTYCTLHTLHLTLHLHTLKMIITSKYLPC